MNTSNPVGRPGDQPGVQSVRRDTGDDRVYRTNATLPFYGPARVGAGQLNPVRFGPPPASWNGQLSEQRPAHPSIVAMTAREAAT